MGTDASRLALVVAERDAAIKNMNSSLHLVAELRSALGDEGKLMQLELLEHAAAVWRDAKALRLAVQCEMDVFVRGCRCTEAVGPMVAAVKVDHGADPLEATRIAIERVAASMGKKA